MVGIDMSGGMSWRAAVSVPKGEFSVGCIEQLFSATAVLGLRRLWMRPGGAPAYVREFARLQSQVIDAFAHGEPRLRRCGEPMITEALAGTMAPLRYEHTARAALTGLPVSVVWSLARG
jgi:hypothetical protein